LDLAYIEDSGADVDLNLVATKSGAIIEIQGTAEGAPVPRVEIERMTDMALDGIRTLCERQERVLTAAGVDLKKLIG
jgi:ribonuclease PH